MNFLRSKKIIAVTAGLLVVVLVLIMAAPASRIDFNTQVKPILNKKCITCHGGVKQNSGFSLLFREEALGHTKSGKAAIVPGHPEQSELVRRINETDPEERMPYQHPPLSAAEIRVLTQWIKEGAAWGQHWAYVPVKQEEVPDFSDKWIRNDVDQFIFEKLKEEKLTPSAEADKATLLRRVSLDLTGLPPAKQVADKFMNDPSPKAYDNLVNELLASPAYGERWTALWLDLARYADTRGYEADRGRSIWKYRDWLINAFNADKPYDQFLTEQLAGDLMPNPDDAKYIATAFHRNSLTNDEGGTDDEEFRTSAVLDRVNTTWSALMGTTFNCVQCHSHPYDPFKHEEYYKFMAFFNNSRDEDTEGDYPLLRQYDSRDSIKLAQLKDWLSNNVSPEEAKNYYNFLKTWQPTINAPQCDEFVNGALSGTVALRNNGTCRLKNVHLDNARQVMVRYYTDYTDGKWYIFQDSLKGPLLATIALPRTKGDRKVISAPLPPVSGKHNLYFKYFSPSIKTADETGVYFEWFRFAEDFPGKEKAGYDSALKHFNELMLAGATTTPIMIENGPDFFRASYVFERGNRLVKGKEVAPDVPAVMNPMPANAPKNRLGLAMWLIDKKNPLVARTLVNRLWEQLFGAGLAETLEDLGTQGIPPTHRELLDHLAWQFMNDYQWSVKRLLKEIVSSATYRQRSHASEELVKKDPNNKWYARGPRIRLSAEQLRDQALQVSGLLSAKMFGPSVMPFQPDGIWHSPYNGETWKLSNGPDQFRRAVYTYWKRSSPYPSMINFDAGGREVCITRRIRTNTPLQALTSLNDSAYIVMARYFAYRMQEFTGPVDQQIARGYELMMFKPIAPVKLQALVDLYTRSRTKFSKDPAATCEMVAVNDQHNNPTTAALVVVANALLNLDEWVNKN